jgi:hypothetical protein
VLYAALCCRGGTLSVTYDCFVVLFATGTRGTVSQAATLRMYYHVAVAPGWRLVMLDTYDRTTISTHQSKVVERGYSYLRRHNPNNLRGSAGWFDGASPPLAVSA